MNCIVTAGPTYESLDEVRRLTNFSTGKLGVELANHLVAAGNQVTLLRGYYAIYNGESHAQAVQTFTTTQNLLDRFTALAATPVDIVFHAAAVSDFAFGKVWERLPDGTLTECNSGKVSTRSGTLLAELVPTPKIISNLRHLYPAAKIIGWKYEVDGDRTSVLTKAVKQISENGTTACVVNGKAYGPGFGLVMPAGACTHFTGANLLYAAMAAL